MRLGWKSAPTFFLMAAALVSRPVLASSSANPHGQGKSAHAQSLELCRMQRSTVRELWQRHDYAASPTISDTMVAAIDGDIATVRKGLQDLPPEQAVRWRQTALSQAELGNHPNTVRALIADGADPNGRAWIPPYTTRTWEQAMKIMSHDAHLGPLTEAMRKNSAGMNQGMSVPPPLFRAAQCDETQVMIALIEGGASVNAYPDAQSRIGDALLVSVLSGNAAATRLLLDHGAEACRDNRLMARNARRTHLAKAFTVAGIARNNGLPADLVARLQCPAP